MKGLPTRSFAKPSVGPKRGLIDADLGGGVIKQRLARASLKLLTLVAKRGLQAVA